MIWLSTDTEFVAKKSISVLGKKVRIIEFSGNEHKWEKETVGNENAIKKNWV